MLTYTRINDRLRLQYNGVELNRYLPCKDELTLSLEYEIRHFINRKCYAEITKDYLNEHPPMILTPDDLKVVEQIIRGA